MADLRTIPERRWATPEQVRELIAELPDDAENFRWISIAVVAETESGEVYTRSTRTKACMTVASHFLLMAMKMCGFESSK